MTRGRLDLRPDLDGLGASDLALLAIVCAIGSALLHSAYLHWLGFDLAATGSPVIMCVGNAIGTFLALCLLKLVRVLLSAR